MNPLDDPTFSTFRDLARLAGHRDDLVSQLMHVRRNVAATLTSAHDAGVSVAALAEAAGLSRESVYQAVARHRELGRLGPERNPRISL